MKLICAAGIAVLVLLFTPSCKEKEKPSLDANQEMAQILDSIYDATEVPQNVFSATAVRAYYDSLFAAPDAHPSMEDEYGRAIAYLNMGEEKKAIDYLQSLLDRIPERNVGKRGQILKDMALAWLRLGERSNCISNHTGESCIFPVKGGGVHSDPMGSENAIKIYENLLRNKPGDLEARWLLNIAYMTVGGYPDKVPKEYLLTMPDDTSYAIKPFVDAAMKTGLDVKNVSGTSIFDDFNNDGYLDLITSSMSLKEGLHYFRNNGDGTFSDLSQVSKIDQLHGGLNIMHTDYNNDGFKDIFVTRGGWKAGFGNEPKSLIQNNGDGTFTDVTKKSGLMSFYPCMTANWSDLNNDGWLDLIMGNEPNGKGQSPTQVFLNNKNGTFTEISKLCGIDIAEHVKGVNAGDYNNDGLTDVYISAMTGKKFLFKNEGVNKDGMPLFKNVTKEAGITNRMGSFSTWFFDYDNDGWLDIFNCLYENSTPIAYYAGAISLGMPYSPSGNILLYRNNHDGTFTDVSEKMGLNKMFYSMGSNFGDIDNDGWLDFYICTGNPDFSALYPNKMFRNVEGKYFEDVTGSARVGSIQKAHGTCFADVDNDGDEDLYIEQGGPLNGDAYQNAFYINPGHNKNHWITLTLKGVKSNSVAIGSRVKVTFIENNKERSVYRSITTGSSYGANPHQLHVGIGNATKIKNVEIKWPASNTVQNFNNLEMDKTFVITEGQDKAIEQKLKKLDFLDPNRLTIGCAPITIAKSN